MTTEQQYDADFETVRALVASKYVRDPETDLDGSYQDEGALNDALANTWIEDMTTIEWQAAVERRLGIGDRT